MGTQITSTHPWVAEAKRGVRFGIIPFADQEWRALRDFAQTAEGMGIDALFLPDHPIAPLNSWAPLAALAEATRTIRLGTLVNCVFYHHPFVLAREVANVDRISGGRAIVGLGSGDMPHEFQQMGLAYPPVRTRQEALE